MGTLKDCNRGFAIPLVMIILVVLSVLIMALMNMSMGDAKAAAWQTNTTQAHYLGRSGVHSGVKILQQQLSAGTYTDINTAITAANNHIASNGGPTFSVAGVGTYTIGFTVIDSQTIKITSVGTANGSNRTVTLTTRLSFPASTVTNPDNWVAGINLTHSVNTGANYLGQGVTLEGKPIRSPQGGNNPSTFQASSIIFTDYGGLSLKQINNSVHITFDSEILYFQTGTELNNDSPTATKNGVYFSISDAVVSNRPSGPLAYGISVGFEDVGRYQAFINGMSGGVDYSGYYTDDPIAFPDTYPFLPGVRYGVVYFGGDVTGYSIATDIDEGYYFYAHGVDLKAVDLVDNDLLIPVEDDDLLIKAIEAMFKYTLGSSQPRMWDNK